MKPLLAVFPKAYMQALCKDGSMSLFEWIDLAARLKVDGLEWYAGFTEMKEEKNWIPLRKAVESQGMKIPMLCCSPDFTHPDLEYRQNEVRKQKKWISMIHEMCIRDRE